MNEIKIINIPLVKLNNFGSSLLLILQFSLLISIKNGCKRASIGLILLFGSYYKSLEIKSAAKKSAFPLNTYHIHNNFGNFLPRSLFNNWKGFGWFIISIHSFYFILSWRSNDFYYFYHLVSGALSREGRLSNDHFCNDATFHNHNTIIIVCQEIKCRWRSYKRFILE